MIDQIKWLGHGSFVIQGTPIIFIDPWRVVRTAFHADLILISHDHYDHCSTADVNKLRGPDTTIIGNERVSEQIPNTTILRPWQSITIERANIKAVPAYSSDDMPHPRKHGGLGFVISVNYYDIYYAGDTELTPELERIQPDIAILPIDGNGTMNIEEAAEAVDIMRPRWVLPANWGPKGDGASEIDAKQFQQRVGGTAEVLIPNN